MKKISISFVCCVKNEVKYVSKLYNSVLNSSPGFLNWDLIFVDDHSEDDTFKLLSKIALKDQKVKLVKNKGIGKVMGTQTGINLASGEWIKFLDGDDYVSFESLDPEDFRCDAFYHDYIRIYKSNQLTIKLTKSLSKNPKLWKFDLRSIPKAMYFSKKSIFKETKGLNKCIFEDLYINQSIQRNAKKINKVDKSLYYYRQHDSNHYGDSFFGNPVKVRRMGERINNMIDVLETFFTNEKINPSLRNYGEFLKNFSFSKLVLLLSSPRLFFKAVYYLTISKISFS